MSDVRVREAESEKEHLFADHVPFEHLQKAGPGLAVELVVILRDNHFRRMIHGSAHLIEDRSAPTARPCSGRRFSS